jgi:broad specificity phosphatase PhoE
MLLLIRHGQTTDNARRVFQGHGGGPLTETGRAQIERLAVHLRALYPQVTTIVSSDLERAVQSRLLLQAAIKESAPLASASDNRLREVDVGTWQGRSQEDLEASLPGEWQAWKRGEDVRRGGGETYAEAATRFCAAIAELQRAPGTKLVVSHGGAIRAAVARLLNLPMLQLGSLDNASVTSLEASESGYRLHRYNFAL